MPPSALPPDETSVIDWATAGSALAGEVVSGDLHVVAPFSEGVLVGLIDGLGHGPEAAEAARVAASLLAHHASEYPTSLIQRCHEALRKTRGAVLSIASFDASSSLLTWSGVGNVEGVLLRSDPVSAAESIPVRGGVVGYKMPPLRADVLSILRGDTLILATDGIRNDFKVGLIAEQSPRDIADSILRTYGRTTDDACVVVARYNGLTQVTVPVHRESDVVMARKRVREQAHKAGLHESAVEALATAVTEVARNIVVHAVGGEVRIAIARDGGRSGLIVVATDDGPGIADPERALRDNYSTGSGLGLGLSSAKRLVDEFEVSSAIGRGTTVTLRKWRR